MVLRFYFIQWVTASTAIPYSDTYHPRLPCGIPHGLDPVLLGAASFRKE